MEPSLARNSPPCATIWLAISLDGKNGHFREEWPFFSQLPTHQSSLFPNHPPNSEIAKLRDSKEVLFWTGIKIFDSICGVPCFILFRYYFTTISLLIHYYFNTKALLFHLSSTTCMIYHSELTVGISFCKLNCGNSCVEWSRNPAVRWGLVGVDLQKKRSVARTTRAIELVKNLANIRGLYICIPGGGFKGEILFGQSLCGKFCGGSLQDSFEIVL